MFFLLDQYADPVTDAIEECQLSDGCLHHRDGLFSLMCGTERYLHFSDNDTYTNEVYEKFRSLFCDADNGRFNPPDIAIWYDQMKMSHIIGLNFAEIGNQRRIILAIESRLPIDKYRGGVHFPESSRILTDFCKDCDSANSCELCMNEPEIRIGCQRAYPKIRSLVNKLMKNRFFLEETNMLLAGKACPNEHTQS